MNNLESIVLHFNLLRKFFLTAKVAKFSQRSRRISIDIHPDSYTDFAFFALKPLCTLRFILYTFSTASDHNINLY